MCKAINTLQHMVRRCRVRVWVRSRLRCEPRAGELLVPYYRQLLPAAL